MLGGINLQAETKTIEITPTQLPAKGYKVVSTYDDNETGFSFAIAAYNSNGWQVNSYKSGSRACFFAITNNPNNYIIKEISVSISNGTAGLTLYKSDTGFTGTTYTELHNSVGKGTEVESLTGATTATSTKTIDSNYIGLRHDDSAGAFSFNKVVITYEDASGPAKQDPKLHFEREARFGKLGVGVVWEAAKHLSDGTLTYTSSNPDIVAVNATTGQILPEDVKAAGTAVITATLEATDTYQSAEASYIINILDPANTEIENRVTFDFSNPNPYGMETYYNGDFPSNTQFSTNEGNVSLVIKGKYRSYGSNKANPEGNCDVRIGQNASLTISVPANNCVIEKITLNTEKAFDIDQTKGSIAQDSENKLRVWTPKDGVSVSEVSFTNSASSYKPIKSVTVVWKDVNSDLEIANLSFDQTVYNTTVGVETEINPVNNPNNVAATYSIDCLNDDEYTLTEADGKLAVTVNKMGVYTLRAKSEATDAYLPGIAILRLNVFPVVGINVNEAPATPIENAIAINNGDKLSFGELPMTVQLFHLMEIAEETKPAARAAQITHDDIDAEYTGEPIEFTQPGYLHYYMRYANAYNSPIHTLTVNVDGKTPTGIENVSADNTNAPVEYFNLQGIRVDNPAAGLYIRRQGNATTKVIVK